MALYKYQPYYRFDGPNRLQPFLEKLTPDEVEDNLECFFSEVERYFEDGTAEFEKLSDSCIGITSDISEDECDERVKGCLNILELYAYKTCKN
jgi:hypothetical protein